MVIAPLLVARTNCPFTIAGTIIKVNTEIKPKHLSQTFLQPDIVIVERLTLGRMLLLLRRRAVMEADFGRNGKLRFAPRDFRGFTSYRGADPAFSSRYKIIGFVLEE
jgi:hypothetical protein